MTPSIDPSQLLLQQMDATQMASLKSRVDELQSQNEALKLRQAKSEKDTHEFVSYFQRELSRKDDVIADLTEKGATEKVHWDMKLSEMETDTTDTLQHFKKAAHEKETSLTLQVVKSKEELIQLSHFRERKEVLEQQLEALEIKCATDLYNGQETVRDLERKALEERAKLQKIMDKKIEKIKLESREETQNGLDAETRKILMDNKRMSEELRFQLETTHELQMGLNKSSANTRVLGMDVSLYLGQEKEYALQGQKKTAEIRHLQLKVKNLERSLSQVVSEFEREKKMILLKNKREVTIVFLKQERIYTKLIHC